MIDIRLFYFAKPNKWARGFSQTIYLFIYYFFSWPHPQLKYLLFFFFIDTYQKTLPVSLPCLLVGKKDLMLIWAV
jgi:hypothetical protein